MNTRLTTVRRSLGYLMRALVGHGSIVLLVFVAGISWGTVTASSVTWIEGLPVWAMLAPAVVVLVAAVLFGLPVTRWSARWELRAAGELLDRVVPKPDVLPRVGRALGWAFVKLSVGMALLVSALAPLLLFAAAAYMYLDGLLISGDVESPVGDLREGIVGIDMTRPIAWPAASVAVGVAWLLFLTPVLARLHARLTIGVLASRVTELEERVGELAETRAGAVDAHTAELRRIERDLHDGMQAQLVNVAMRLGMAERRMQDDPAAVGTLIEEARTGTEEAMGGLRDVLRTMYPPVLADRGLRGALVGLAGRSTTATTVDMPDAVDVPAPVEAAAYFVVAEALTNVTKHSAASHADVTVRREPRSLLVEVTDNGLGGADEDRGTGIVGMRRRVAALDGWLEVTSPAGGPTVVVAELPCES